MKHALVSLVLALVPMTKAAPLDLDRMIEAVGQIEGGAWGKPGGIGCMGYSAWSQHSSLPFQASMRAETALPVYRAHLAWIIETLPLYRVSVTPAAVYLCWRRGLDGAVKILRYQHRPMPEQAVRCANLYYDLSPARLPIGDDQSMRQERDDVAQHVSHKPNAAQSD